MLKQLAALGLGAALVLAPVASFAQTATPTPTPMVVVHHKVVHHPMVKKPMVKKPIPTPTPTKS
jgi:hypothetical protein